MCKLYCILLNLKFCLHIFHKNIIVLLFSIQGFLFKCIFTSSYNVYAMREILIVHDVSDCFQTSGRTCLRL